MPGIGSFRPGKRGEEKGELQSKTDPVLIAWRRQLGEAVVTDRYGEYEGRPVRIVSVADGGTSVDYEFSVASWRSALHRSCTGNKFGYWVRAWAWLLIRFPIVLALVMGPDLRDLPEFRRWTGSLSWRWWQIRRGLDSTVRSFPYGSLARFVWRFVLLTSVVGVLAMVALSGALGAAGVGVTIFLVLCCGCTSGGGMLYQVVAAARGGPERVVIAHSLGGYLSYQAFQTIPRPKKKRATVTFTSVGSGLRPVHILSCLRSNVKAALLTGYVVVAGLILIPEVVRLIAGLAGLLGINGLVLFAWGQLAVEPWALLSDPAGWRGPGAVVTDSWQQLMHLQTNALQGPAGVLATVVLVLGSVVGLLLREEFTEAGIPLPLNSGFSWRAYLSPHDPVARLTYPGEGCTVVPVAEVSVPFLDHVRPFHRHGHSLTAVLLAVDLLEAGRLKTPDLGSIRSAGERANAQNYARSLRRRRLYGMASLVVAFTCLGLAGGGRTSLMSALWSALGGWAILLGGFWLTARYSVRRWVARALAGPTADTGAIPDTRPRVIVALRLVALGIAVLGAAEWVAVGHLPGTAVALLGLTLCGPVLVTAGVLTGAGYERLRLVAGVAATCAALCLLFLPVLPGAGLPAGKPGIVLGGIAACEALLAWCHCRRGARMRPRTA
ncbi:hypothetical protein ABJI51_39520 [Amycolatopsis sp. NEAU-NG30]|uniref:Uncharacterized protein n=1 Tax=Amycolatopsis melonis TaxID=3156488 RepID=A0ABV0LSB4_9PSEU